MSEPFMILRPSGSGYVMSPLDRKDAPMSVDRIDVITDSGFFDTQESVDEHVMFIGGVYLNNPAATVSDLYFKKEDGIWELHWSFTDTPGPGASIVFIRVSKGFCSDLT